MVSLNSLRPRQNGRHFTDDVFKRIFLNENVWILLKISLKFVPKGLINNIPSLVQVMAWRRPGDKPLSGPMLVSLLTHICVTWPQWVNVVIIYTLMFSIRKCSWCVCLYGNYLQLAKTRDTRVKRRKECRQHVVTSNNIKIFKECPTNFIIACHHSKINEDIHLPFSIHRCLLVPLPLPEAGLWKQGMFIGQVRSAGVRSVSRS